MTKLTPIRRAVLEAVRDGHIKWFNYSMGNPAWAYDTRVGIGHAGYKPTAAVRALARMDLVALPGRLTGDDFVRLTDAGREALDRSSATGRLPPGTC